MNDKCRLASPAAPNNTFKRSQWYYCENSPHFPPNDVTEYRYLRQQYPTSAFVVCWRCSRAACDRAAAPQPRCVNGQASPPQAHTIVPATARRYARHVGRANIYEKHRLVSVCAFAPVDRE